MLHAPRHAPLARQVLRDVRRPLPLPGFGPGAVPESTTIVLAADAEQFQAAAGGVPEWAGGVAVPHARLIVVPAYPVPGIRPLQAAATLRHEVVHLALHERLPGSIPRWFDEGYAELASGSWDVESAWALRVAFLLGRAPSLDSLELAWPEASGRARLAYLLSASAVDHLRRRGGERGFALLMENWRREGSLDASLRVTYGMTVSQLEREWRGAVRARYGWLQLAANAGVLWVVATALALVAWIPRRRRNRRRLDVLEREERLLPPPREDGVDVQYPLPEPPPG